MRFSTRYSLGEEVFYYDVSLEKIIRSIVTAAKREYYDGLYSTAYDPQKESLLHSFLF